MTFASFCTWVLSKFDEIRLDTLSWYAIISACLILIWLLLRGLYHVMTSRWRSTSFFVLKHFVYPHLLPRIAFMGTATRAEVIATALYIIVNILFITLPMASWARVGARAGTMSVVNLVPLLCGPRLSLMTEILGISLRSSLGSHRWFGRTVVALSVLHIVISLTDGNKFSWTSATVSGVVVGSALGLLLTLSIRVVSRAAYDFFLQSHLALSAVALIALWRHVPASKPAVVYLKIGICLWVIMSAIHWCQFAFRNFVFGRPFATAVVTPLSYVSAASKSDSAHVMRVDITVPRPWKVRAGQHVYLSIPKLGLVGVRGHPFVIAWWHRDRRGLAISLVIESKAGFTRELGRNANKTMRAFVDGPFGIPHNFGSYGTVIMIATGMGIAGHTSYLKDLINRYNACEVVTRRIHLVWQLQEDCQGDCVKPWMLKPWMDKILLLDTKMASIYVQEYGKTDVNYDSHSKIKEISTPLDIEGLLQEEISAQQGNIIVSVCARNDIADRVRTQVQAHMDERMRLVELDFQPLHKSSVSDTTGMDFSCRG